MKHWALLAKKAKDFYYTPECKFLQELTDSCFSQALKSHLDQSDLLCAYLDLLNTLLSSEKNTQTRRYLVYMIQDKHLMTILSLACKNPKLSDREAIKKRADELRHYLNVSDQGGQGDQRAYQLADQKFYKRIALFNKICFKCFRDDF